MSEDSPDNIPVDPYLAALRKDLEAYDNPEVFYDASLPQVYHLTIRSLHAPTISHVFEIEVNGKDLPHVLRETLISSITQDPNFDGDMEGLRNELATDEDYADTELYMRRFFVRHLPKLMVQVYNIAVSAALVSGVGTLIDRRVEREQLLKLILKQLLQGFEKDIKAILNTRSSGRPSVAEDPLPDIVRQVLETVRELMGGQKGKDAVPVLKTVADRLDLTETALRKKLVRARHPWAGIKTYFENES